MTFDIFDKLPFSEKRFIERYKPKMKSVFQLGGAGSVGIQSLWGMFHLSKIIFFCEENKIPLHCWPYDGLNIPGGKHVLIEIYPGHYNNGEKSDENDALATARFFMMHQQEGTLPDLFNYVFKYEIERKIRREGWVPGINFKDKIKST